MYHVLQHGGYKKQEIFNTKLIKSEGGERKCTSGEWRVDIVFDGERERGRRRGKDATDINIKNHT